MMRKILILSILFMVILNLHSDKVSADTKIPVSIVKIKDGDTIDVKLKNNNSFPVRLMGMMASKPSQA